MARLFYGVKHHIGTERIIDFLTVTAGSSEITVDPCQHIIESRREDPRMLWRTPPFSVVSRVAFTSSMLWGGCMAVSYTHLDVYKRQVPL